METSFQSTSSQPPRENRVYVIDDDRSLAKTISLFLGMNLDCVVETFENAEDFLVAYDASSPSCILSDYKMPCMTGLELQEELHNRGIAIPMIFVSGQGNISVAVAAMERGAVSFLEKPVKPDVLVSKVTDALAIAHRQFAQLNERMERKARFSKLTSKEIDVLHEILNGKLNKQIAKALQISLRTVERRKHEIYDKLGCRSAVELAQLCNMGSTEPDNPPSSH